MVRFAASRGAAVAHGISAATGCALVLAAAPARAQSHGDAGSSAPSSTGDAPRPDQTPEAPNVIVETSPSPAAPPASSPMPPSATSSAPGASPPPLTPEYTTEPAIPRYLMVSLGVGLSDQYATHHGSGTGFYAEGEYALEVASWFMPRAYAGLLLTFPDRGSCDGSGAPCDVSTKIGFAGGKIRLLAPIPYVAPFIELGLGLSVGVLTTRTPEEDDGSVNLAYNIPVTLGLALGKDHGVEVALAYLVHPAAKQVDGALALSLAFPLR